MRRLFNEWWSIQRAKNPGGVVIGVILLFAANGVSKAIRGESII